MQANAADKPWFHGGQLRLRLHNDPNNAVHDKNKERCYRGRSDEQFDWYRVLHLLHCCLMRGRS
jgi:hypothetical protein